jgi:hypothetical protein
VRSLGLANPSEIAFEGLTISLRAEPPVFRGKSWTVDRLAPGAALAVRDLDTPLDIERLAGLNETEYRRAVPNRRGS